ncbi:MAG: hypothetical protein RLY58_939 [Pseudomonadota bacterium]
MNALKLTALTLVMAASATAAQAADIVTIPDVSITGSVAATTDYLFRGISQSSNNAAIQGSLVASHTSGVYGSLWGSSIANGTGGSEMDASIGYATKLAALNNATLDVGFMRYVYAGANDKNMGSEPDYNEIYGSVRYDSVVSKDDMVKVGGAFTNEYYAEADQFLNLFVDYSTPIAGTNFGLVTHVGFNNFDDEKMMNKALTTSGTDDSYIDYKIGTTFGVQGLAAELSYVGSDIKKKDCGGNLCEGRAVFSLSKAF